MFFLGSAISRTGREEQMAKGGCRKWDEEKVQRKETPLRGPAVGKGSPSRPLAKFSQLEGDELKGWGRGVVQATFLRLREGASKEFQAWIS